MRHFFISTLLLLVTSCNQAVDRTENDTSIEIEKTAKELKADSNFNSLKHEAFVLYILNDRVRKHGFDYVLDNCRYQELLPNEGLEEIIAFSDKNYPKKVAPTDYEHFILFCFKYTTSNQAKLNFDNFYLLTQLDTSKYDSVEKSLIAKHEKIKIASKPGGLIVQENEWIYSLVKTCREAPIGGNWADYENLFLSYLGNNHIDSLMVLNADCGKMNYRKEKRATHYNGYKQ